MRMKKKVFQTEKLNEIRQQQKRSFLIFPAIMVVLLIWGGPANIAQLNKDNFVTGVICIMFLLVSCSAMLGIIPFYMIYVRLQGQKKQVMENSPFITMDNLDYYRDKLEEVSPGAISMLEDLRIETDKDMAACILHYEMLGLIRQTEDGYERINRLDFRNAGLQESDRYLIVHLQKGDWKQEQVVWAWEQQTVSEVKEAGWITERFRNKKDIEKTTKKESKMVLLWLVTLIVFCLAVSMGMLKERLRDTMSQEQFEKIPQAVFVLGDIQQEVLDGLDGNQAFGAFSKQMLTGPNYLWKLTLVVVMDCTFLLLFLFPVLYMKFGQGRIREQSPYKRTETGEIYTEYIFGMKNFIHDYSNLSEVEKDALVLLDDYLIYAVVLEENKKIVEEIMKRRAEI